MFSQSLFNSSVAIPRRTACASSSYCSCDKSISCDVKRIEGKLPALAAAFGLVPSVGVIVPLVCDIDFSLGNVDSAVDTNAGFADRDLWFTTGNRSDSGLNAHEKLVGSSFDLIPPSFSCLHRLSVTFLVFLLFYCGSRGSNVVTD